jgi:hypothetical protein
MMTQGATNRFDIHQCGRRSFAPDFPDGPALHSAAFGFCHDNVENDLPV